MKRSTVAALAGILLLAACTPATGDGPGLLVVIDDDGNILTMAPDGTGVTALTDDAGPQRVYTQPTWSPDGERLAWVEIRGDREPGLFVLASTQMAGSSQIRITGPDGTQPRSITTPFIPFFLMWDPAGARIAFLGNDGTQVGLGLADLESATASGIDRGTPYYLAWEPDGEHLLVHVGTNRLDLVDLEGEPRRVARPGAFRSPAWAPNGDRAYVVRDGDGQRLVIEHSDRETEVVAGTSGFTSLVLSQDGERVAYVDSFPPDGATFGDLMVNEEPSPVASNILAFFWSPGGDRLLYLRHDLTEAPWLRWGVWDGEATVEFARFRPSDVLAAHYLPFFDQYAQSLAFWSPDGDAFVYAGLDEAGEQGIWVQPVEEGASPQLVSSGVLAAWSPPR